MSYDPSPLHPERGTRLRSIATELISTNTFANVSWDVLVDNQIVASGEVGQRGCNDDQPVSRDAIYRIYSMTKPLISVLALQLVEAGKLVLSAPVANYLPRFSEPRVLLPNGGLIAAHRPITIEDLLTHRAGFSYDFIVGCPVASLYRDAAITEDGSRSLTEFMDVLADLPLCAQPGNAWRYSVSIDVLAAVLEVVANKPLIDLLNDSLLQPLGMSDTTFQLSDAQVPRLLPMHGLRPLGQPMLTGAEHVLQPLDVNRSHPLQSPTFMRGGFGLYSTRQDYLKFMRLLMDGASDTGEALLSPPMLDYLWTNRLPASQLPMMIGPRTIPGYGWGLTGRVMLNLGEALSLTSLGEGGWAGAASTYFWVDRRRRFSGLVMTQFIESQVPLADLMQTAAYQSLQTAPNTCC